MKFPKFLIPFLAVVLPTIHFTHNEPDIKVSKKSSSNREEEIAVDESEIQGIILRLYDDSDRFLRFAKHTSHRSHSSHKSHSSHRSGNHTSHYSSSGNADCNGCEFNVEDEELQETTNSENLVAIK